VHHPRALRFACLEMLAPLVLPAELHRQKLEQVLPGELQLPLQQQLPLQSAALPQPMIRHCPEPSQVAS